MEYVVCDICPRQCRLKSGQTGVCRARQNVDGRIVLLTYGLPCSVNVDPVEKKPLYHFLPGSKTFSIGMAGCNINCLNCQNAEISQSGPLGLPAYELPSGATVAAATERGCPSISYTYTEPLVAFEYVRDCAEAARRAGVRNVLVTAGYGTPATISELAKVIDAANVDLKSIDDKFYREICGVNSVKPVLDALNRWREAGVWLEVTVLLIPTKNDSDKAISDLVNWVVANLGREVPIHFSRFFPIHRLTELPPTPIETLARAVEIANAAGLVYAYTGNADVDGGSDTVCAGCGEVLIRRQRFSVFDNRLQEGKCVSCGRVATGVWR
jgi:pyruvate formate lyase activating enzyme